MTEDQLKKAFYDYAGRSGVSLVFTLLDVEDEDGAVLVETINRVRDERLAALTTRENDDVRCHVRPRG